MPTSKTKVMPHFRHTAAFIGAPNVRHYSSTLYGCFSGCPRRIRRAKARLHLLFAVALTVRRACADFTHLHPLTGCSTAPPLRPCRGSTTQAINRLFLTKSKLSNNKK